MPKLSPADEKIFRKTMLPRVSECFFTQEDVKLITKETKMDNSVIQHWAYSLRWRMVINLLGTSVQEYLKASAESLAEKVFCRDVLAPELN